MGAPPPLLPNPGLGGSCHLCITTTARSCTLPSATVDIYHKQWHTSVIRNKLVQRPDPAVEECSAPAPSARAAPAGCPEEDPDDWDDPDDWEVDRVFEALAQIELRLSAIEACSAPAPSACVASGQ